MKTILSSFFLVIFSLMYSQFVNIPDPNFKSYLVGNSAINTNGDTEISVAEAVAYTGFMNCNTKSISSLTGIEAFVNLTGLNCNFNKLTNLDLSANVKLNYLDCSYNRLTGIDLSNNLLLKTLIISGNTAITSLNTQSLVNLETFEASRCSINAIDVTKNLKLKSLDVAYNQLTAIDISKNINLQDIHCNNNKIVNIDVSPNINLTAIDCRNNNLKSLNLNNGKTLYFNLMRATGNPSLTCIQVDKMSSVRTTTWDYDSTASFSTNCNYSLGVRETNLDNQIQIYPNPASDKVFIKSPTTPDSLKVYSMTGQLILSSNRPNEVNVSTWEKGIYLFVLQIDNNKVIKEVVVN